MSLSAGLNIARSALGASASEAAVISRNISSADDPGYAKRTAVPTSIRGGGVDVFTVQRSNDEILEKRLLDAASLSAAHQSLLEPLNQLQSQLGSIDSPHSISGNIRALEEALQVFSNNPGDTVRARAAITAARDLADTLNAASQSVQQLRQTSDGEMAQSVTRINSLLQDFEAVNSEITGNFATGRDLNDQFDARDRILTQLSAEIGIRVLEKENFGLAVYTDSGVTLFDKVARDVTFEQTPGLTSASPGNAVYADGVAVTGSDAVMPIRSGTLYGLAQFRDDAAVTAGAQIDEIARAVIEGFAERDVAGTGQPDVTGLFSHSGSPAVPAVGLQPGIASEIRINANVDPAQGGNPLLLRDGGISFPGDPAYTQNTSGAAGFSDRILDLITNLQTDRNFDGTAGAGDTGSIISYGAASVAWLEGTRAQADQDAQYSATLEGRAAAALSNATGVNIDEELSALLDLERSYEATARIISAVDNMFASLFAAMR